MHIIDIGEVQCILHTAEELNSVKCPHCGASYYRELHTTTTAVYYSPVYKNGVNINPDQNAATTYCRCLECGKDFAY